MPLSGPGTRSDVSLARAFFADLSAFVGGMARILWKPDMVRIDPVQGGAVLAVKVVPGSSRDGIVGPLGDRLKVAVRKPPEKGEANKAVCGLIAAALGVRTSDIEVARGAARARKDLLVKGLPPEEIRRRLGLSGQRPGVPGDHRQ